MRSAVTAVTAIMIVCGGATASVAKPKLAKTAAFEINSTSWTFRKDGEKRLETIDADGKYIVHSGAKHVDHGTAAMKGGKACFTSAMTKEGEVCWTTAPTAIGSTMKAISDKGEKLSATRVKYTPQKM